VSSGWDSTTAVTDSGDICVFGRNHLGQLGLGSVMHNINQFLPQIIKKECFNNQPPCSIACGSEHTIVVADNVVFTWGWNEHGQLGTGNTTDQHSPLMLPHFHAKNISFIGCGCGHTFIGLEETNSTNS